MQTHAAEKRTAVNQSPTRAARRHAGQPAAVRNILRGPCLQPKLKIGAANDRYEQEADRVADRVMRMPMPMRMPMAGLVAGPGPGISGLSASGESIRRMCAGCEDELQRKPADEEEELQRKEAPGAALALSAASEGAIRGLSGGGAPLPASERAFFEPRFGQDFSGVRVHNGAAADNSARAINARAFTLGSDIAFARGEYSPGTPSGRRLLAHELTHVGQQGGGAEDRGSRRALLPVGQSQVQRTLGDGHDLSSPRFSRLLDLEAAYDDESVVRKGSSGRGVQAIQQALYDLGYHLPTHGADGKFGDETKAAVKAYQKDNPPLAEDGKVGDKTMTVLNARFSGVPALPAPAVLSATWTSACVRSVLCPWNPHTIDVLRTRITLKSFDSISWADEEWNGAAWTPAPFPGGGYNTGTEIGVLNSSCKNMSETLYHEVLHAEQPTTQSTTLEKESYAYRIGEEFSIAMGLAGRPSLRSNDPQGRAFADPAKVGAFVTTAYPSVPAGGGGEQIIGKAVAPGHIRVRRADGTIYTRPAVAGEKVPGPITLVNEVTHATAGWTCP